MKEQVGTKRSQVKWYCVTQNCDNVLGHVLHRDLVLDLSAITTVNTDGTALAVTCSECGMPKVWYPGAEDALIGAYKAMRRDLHRS